MANTDKQPIFLSRGYEASGTHPALDHPIQFAAVRTDSGFNVIGEFEVFYYEPVDDHLPQSGAVLITGITP